MPRRRRPPLTRAAAVAIVAGATACAGCSTEEEQVPIGCSADPGDVREALSSAPAPVRLGGARLSECLGSSGQAADLQTVGFAFTDVAADLADEARDDPSGPEATQLGYLVGAVRERAGQTGGLHDELRRRLEQELQGVDTSAPAFREGERAGRASG
jgi:hypothetical protein